jgi:hypothetical protein
MIEESGTGSVLIDPDPGAQEHTDPDPQHCFEDSHHQSNTRKEMAIFTCVLTVNPLQIDPQFYM